MAELQSLTAAAMGGMLVAVIAATTRPPPPPGMALSWPLLLPRDLADPHI